jgi:uncharacterized phage protein gp47/JayE
MHGHIQHISKQIIPSTENDDEIAERWGDFWLGDDGRKAAVQSTGSILVTGTPTTNMAAGTVWQRADGEQFDTDSLATVGGGGSVSVPITAIDPGADGNTDVGTTLSIVTPISGIDSNADVEDDGSGGGLTGGSDIESIEDLIERVELRVQSPPKGGGPGDYVQWALEVAGVTRAFEFPLQNGPGTVFLTFVRDNDSPIIPTAGQVTAMQTYIDARRPVTAILSVAAPTAVPLNASIQLAPNTAAVQAQVDLQLTDYLQRRGNDGATLLISEINEAISLASGETDHVLVSPASNKAHAVGTIPTLGTTTYNPIP